jgi:hypothetical protein
MASIGAFVIGAGMTGGFAYGIHKLRKDKKTDTTTYKVFIAGLVIGVVILAMAMFMGGKAAKEAVQMKGGLGGPTDQQIGLMSSEQLNQLEAATREKISGLMSLIERISKAIEAKVASNAEAAAAAEFAAAQGIELPTQ